MPHPRTDWRQPVWQATRVATWAAICTLFVTAPAVTANPDVTALNDRLGPRPEFSERDPDRVALGRLLFFDPVISGNRNISCATCHHPRLATGDGLSLGLGEGGIGLGRDRTVDPNNAPEQRIPRNAQALFNLGATSFKTFFHDGRLEADPGEPDGIRTPLGGDMVSGFDSALSAQAMFPVLSPDEMAGHYSENPIAAAVRQGRLTGPDGAWALITQRVTDIPTYRDALHDLFGDDHEVGFADIANVIADFIAVEWRADDSPFDQAVRGDAPLPPAAERGLRMFYGKANCASCHTGWLQTDQQFHSIGMPQLGPGKAARFESHSRDDGRLRVTGRAEDRFRFRTPSLRNVAQTAPYGHAGAFDTLEAVVRHHLDPAHSLTHFDRSQAVLPDGIEASDWREWEDASARAAIAQSIDIAPVDLSDGEVEDLIAFLHSLTDESWRARSDGVPASVPSGLAVDQ